MKMDSGQHSTQREALRSGGDRDEYGHLTLEAQCRFLAAAGRDPGWPLRDPMDDTAGTAGLGFRTARDLCDAMRQGLTLQPFSQLHVFCP